MKGSPTMTKHLHRVLLAVRRAHKAAMTRRAGRLLAAFALAAGLVATAAPAALAASSATSHAQVASKDGWIRLAHLSPNAPAVDVYLYSIGNSHALIVLHHVSYGTVSPYESVQSGGYTVAMRPAGKPASSPPVLSTSVTIKAGHAYTVAGMGPASGLRLQVLDDALSTPHGRALVRIIQASLKQTRVTVTVGSHVVTRNLAFGSATSYESVPAGTWHVHVAGSSQTASSSVSLPADTTHTIVVLDDPGHLSIDTLTDAAGSNLMPSGGAQTGFGGMAPRPGSSPLPWLLALAVGALVTAGGGLRLWQTKRPRPQGVHAK
jgi:hypothetical protein